MAFGLNWLMEQEELLQDKKYQAWLKSARKRLNLPPIKIDVAALFKEARQLRPRAESAIYSYCRHHNIAVSKTKHARVAA